MTSILLRVKKEGLKLSSKEWVGNSYDNFGI